MRHLAAVAITCMAAALATACLSPPAQFYTLSAVADAGAPPLNASIMVGPVAVPATVDRPQIVVTTGANQVSIDEYSRWASPVQDNIARVVAENLVIMLGTPRITLASSPLGAETDYRVQIEVRTFESVPGKDAALEAVWTVRRIKDGRTETGRTSTREPVRGDGFDALAAAHSRALGKMSEGIAAAVRALDRAA
jgi:uncharacterized protein